MADELVTNAEFGKKRKNEEDPILVAQRFLNIYRQIHIFNEQRQHQFDDMLLSLPLDIRILLTTLPGGSLLIEHIEEVEQKRGLKSVPLQNKSALNKKNSSNSLQTDPLGKTGTGILNTDLSASISAALEQTEKRYKEDIKALTETVTKSIMESQTAMANMMREILLSSQGLDPAKITPPPLPTTTISKPIIKEDINDWDEEDDTEDLTEDIEDVVQDPDEFNKLSTEVVDHIGKKKKKNRHHHISEDNEPNNEMEEQDADTDIDTLLPDETDTLNAMMGASDSTITITNSQVDDLPDLSNIFGDDSQSSLDSDFSALFNSTPSEKTPEIIVDSEINTPKRNESVVESTDTKLESGLYRSEMNQIRNALKNDDANIAVSLDSLPDAPISLDDVFDLENEEISQPVVHDDSSTSNSNSDWAWEYVDPNNNSGNDDSDDWEWEYVEDDGSGNSDDWEWEYVEDDDNSSADYKS